MEGSEEDDRALTTGLEVDEGSLTDISVDQCEDLELDMAEAASAILVVGSMEDPIILAEAVVVDLP